MDALFKKFVNTGVGYVAQGTKLVQTAIDKLVQENKISEQEGKKIVDDLLKSGDAKRADLEKQFTKLTADLRTRVGLDKDAPKPAATKAKTATAKPTAAKASPAKKPASSPVAKVAGATKKAADKVSAAASKTQHSAAAKAGAEKKEAADKA